MGQSSYPLGHGLCRAWSENVPPNQRVDLIPENVAVFHADCALVALGQRGLVLQAFNVWLCNCAGLPCIKATADAWSIQRLFPLRCV